MNQSGRVSVRGEWPGLVTLRSGWWKAVARPLHDESSDAAIRAERASAEFVGRCAAYLIDFGVEAVHSPPLLGTADRIYRAAGFVDHAQLVLLEADLRSAPREVVGVHPASQAEKDRAGDIDGRAFRGDWRVGRLGLADALAATPDSVMLWPDDGEGFVIVGVSTDIAYIQRIAVDPHDQGRGVGRLLLRGAMAWARRRGARTMLLNTQSDNEKATMLYRSESFDVLPSRLTILRFPA